MRRGLAARTLAAIVTAALLVGACGAAATPAPATNAPATAAPATAAPATAAPATAAPATGPIEGKIRLIGPEPSQGLDPAIAFADASRGPIDLMFDTLVSPDPEGKLVGDLAESWESNADITVWTYHLRPGIKFS